MPVYNFRCNDCGRETKKLTSSSIESIDCECGNFAFRQLPTGVESFTYEIKDPIRGKQVKKGVEKQLKARNKEHHDRYEVAQKIDQHGLEDATKLGWLKQNKKL